MCCTPGRCPCWPREQPFDAAEIDLLGVLRAFAFHGTRREFLVAFHGAAARVQGSRLGYVLSTFVQLRYCSETVLQLWATDREIVKWLLHVGVCPNMGLYQGGRAQYRGWEGGPRHPGRPSQDTKAVLQFWGGWLDPKFNNVFLAHGAYPFDGRRDAVRRWHRWHARASRRLWVQSNLDGVV
jgi:hypothetical protein